MIVVIGDANDDETTVENCKKSDEYDGDNKDNGGSDYQMKGFALDFKIQDDQVISLVEIVCFLCVHV